MTKIKPKGKEINEIRIKTGLSLRGLAIKTKTHYATLSNLEHEKGNVTPRIAKSICEALKQDFDQLFEIVDDEKRC